QNKKGKLTVFIDNYKGIKLDDCVRINKDLRDLFAEELEDYELEVTSPGLATPFKVYQQYEKNIGNKVEVLLKTGQKLEGKLLQVDSDGIAVEEKKRVKTSTKKKTTIRKEHRINFEDMEYTKTIISF
ncbi:MAG: ribosome assembly cofactor RimP, partial [Bacteroidales bacterium]|nr:ribosome assembly cofactor RimP [Bacteroidales bacterium]